VLVLDLDRFKPVNDLYGHAAGDAVLREVAARLRENLREDDLAARAGGDEFVVVCRDATQAAATDTAARLARRLISIISEPIPVATDTSASVGVSIGIASAPGRQAISFEALLLQADAALYRAKAEGARRVSLPRARAGCGCCASVRAWRRSCAGPSPPARSGRISSPW
jgi:diguanylate cyclase (GGDEF)-like protein